MSKGQLVDAMVKLTGREIERLAKDHIEVVQALTSKFHDQYIDVGAQVKEYREALDSMDESLKRAEKFMEILDGGSEE